MSAPAVLLPYQQRWVSSKAEVRVWEKSRRIGASWAIAAECTLIAAERKGQDCWYVGYNKEMAQEFVRDAASWAAQFSMAAQAVEETVIADIQADGTSRDILAYVIRFASGWRITALSSRPNNLRGKQGYVVLDEAAFHERLDELLKAALALLMWGGRVAVLSTHDGVDNPFNQLVLDCRAGKLPYELHRTTLDDAVADGLYRRICLRRGLPWTPANEVGWRENLIRTYGAAADEELFCVPARSGGATLSRALLERQTHAAPVLRRSMSDVQGLRSPDERRFETQRWCDTHLTPLLSALPAHLAHVFGLDFGRVSDLTVIAPVTLTETLERRVPFTVELRNTPFDTQTQILFHLVDRLPRLQAGCLDATGSGAYLAEAAQQRYPGRARGIHLSESWYRDNMPAFQQALEDGQFWIPRDADTVDDLRDLRTMNGVIKLPKGKRKGTDGQLRHGDAAIALALAHAASRLDADLIEFASTGPLDSLGFFDTRTSDRWSDRGFGTVRST